MNCHSFLNVLDLYREGRLAPRRAMKAAEHLASCASCRAKAEPAAAPSATRAPASLKAKLLAAASAESQAPAPSNMPPSAGLALWPREARGIAFAAAALLAAAALVSAFGAPSQSNGGVLAAAEVP